jgi:hypothetical protein
MNFEPKIYISISLETAHLATMEISDYWGFFSNPQDNLFFGQHTPGRNAWSASKINFENNFYFIFLENGLSSDHGNWLSFLFL